jgi:hypothetical protein
MEIAAWLHRLGLEQYEQAFRDNDIDGEVLPELTAEDLISIGVTSVGHRRKLLAAIAALGAAVPASDVTAAFRHTPQADAERRQLTVMFCDLVGSTALSARRSRGSPRGHRCLSPRRRRNRHPARWIRFSVHGRRCIGLFRLPESA